MDHDCEPNDCLLLYVRKYVNKQVYQVWSEIVEFMKNHDKEVCLLSGIYVKKSQLSWNDYVISVSTAGSIVNKFMICMLSHRYKFHVSLILQDGKIRATHQIDEVQSIKMWVMCAKEYFYHLAIPAPPPVVHGQEEKELVVNLPKLQAKQKEQKSKEKVEESSSNKKKKQRRVRRAGKHKGSQNHPVL